MPTKKATKGRAEWRVTLDDDRRAKHLSVTLPPESFDELDELLALLAPDIAKLPPHPTGQAQRGKSAAIAIAISRTLKAAKKK